MMDNHARECPQKICKSICKFGDYPAFGSETKWATLKSKGPAGRERGQYLDSVGHYLIIWKRKRPPTEAASQVC